MLRILFPDPMRLAQTHAAALAIAKQDPEPKEHTLATEQLLLRLPEDLVRWFRRSVSERQRSAFVRTLLENALALQADDDADPLYQAAPEVDGGERLAAEMAEWGVATIADGLDEASNPK